MKVNTSLELVVTKQLIELLKEFKDIFAWTHKDPNGIPLNIVQHKVKHDIHKLLLTTHFIKLVEEAT